MRLGLLAAARITHPAVVAAAASVPEVELAAVAARSLERAQAAADDWGVARTYGSYEELIDDPDLDAIYVATPAALHRRWTLAALAAGKDVLCEKPLAANAAEAREMVDAASASGRLLVEAFHWRYHPMIEQIADVLASGRIGVIRHVHGVFDLPDGHIGPNDIRWDLPLGGGALMDLGCYPVQWVRWAVGGEPEVVSATAECPVPDVDGALTAQLAWPAGATGTIQCSMIAANGPDIRLEIEGELGSIHVVNPLAPQHGGRFEVRVGDDVDAPEPAGAGTTTYEHQLRAFVDAATTRVAPPTSGEDSVATMALIDACYTAAGLAPRPSLPVDG